MSTSGFKFPILTVNGTATSTIVDFDDMFVRKELFLDAGLFSWGASPQGENGLGATTSVSSPVQIGALTNWKQMVCAANCTAAIKTDGTLWSWGLNTSGQLGQNIAATTKQSSPNQVGSLTTWKQVAAGNGSFGGIKTDGTLWMWGLNTTGVLGNSTTNASYSSPIQVGALTTWASMSISGFNAVHAIKTDGTLWAWGRNNEGALGNGSTVNTSSPIQIGTLTGWIQVNGGNASTKAIRSDGTLWAWGFNGGGDMGIGNTINYSSPVQVGSLNDWKFITQDENSTVFAIKNNGTLWAWGFNNTVGMLGQNTTTPAYYSSPIQVGALTNWKQVSVGLAHVVAVKTDGTLWAWGLNTSGQLGQSNTTSVSSPIQVGSLTNWRVVKAAFNGTRAIAAPDN
jgi:alpha-tubulin suppressor-like RCC1 family protein